MSGHLNLLCVRECGRGCGHKISSSLLARITTWKMLEGNVTSCSGEEQFWGRESLGSAELEVAVRRCSFWCLFSLICACPTGGTKNIREFNTWLRRHFLKIRFPFTKLWFLVHLSTASDNLGEAIWGCCTRLCTLSVVLLYSRYSYHNAMNDAPWNWSAQALGNCMWGGILLCYGKSLILTLTGPFTHWVT